MKNNVKILSLATILLLIYGLSSCTSDGYSSGKHWGSLATVRVDDSGYAKSFALDNGETMFVTSSNTSYKPKNERVLIDYTILSENYEGYTYAIKLNGYYEDILTKPIIYIPQDNQHLQDSIGHNKIKVQSMRARAGYITIQFGYNMAGKDQHMLNLVAVDKNLEQDGDKPIKLQFRHNIHKDQENYGSPLMYVSFKLDEYIKANQGNSNLSFEVTWENYAGEKKSETLKYPLSPAVVNPPEVDTE